MSTIVLAEIGEQERSLRLEDLFERHQQRLFRMALRLGRNREDALDLVQETFVRAAGSLGRVPADDAGAEGWLVRVLVNLVRDRWRRQKVRDDARALLTTGTGASDPHDSWVAKRVVEGALERIPPRQRAILVLHEIEGVEVTEIARILGVARVTVRWHLSRARRQLVHAIETGEIQS